MPPVLDIQNLKKCFGDFIAVDTLNFQVEDGSFFSILGPSGCGKTTLLRMIAGFQAPTEGKLLIRTWVRGVEAETLSCGSGIVASALVEMAKADITQIKVKAISGDTLVVTALRAPPLCQSSLRGPTNIVAELTMWEKTRSL